MYVQQHADLGAEVPQRLIEAASEMFARHGYAGPRLRDVVRTADVDLSAVNYYFGGKEGLYAATLKQLADARPANSTMASLPATGQQAEDALYRQVLGILRRFVEGESTSPLGRILAHESMNPTEYFDQLITDIVRPELERLGAIVRRLAGPAADDAMVARIGMSVMGQCLFYLFARGAIDRIYPQVPHKDCEALARHITGLSLMGIAVHSSRPPAT
jgi:AcrR family transcriptional regulator